MGGLRSDEGSGWIPPRLEVVLLVITLRFLMFISTCSSIYAGSKAGLESSSILLVCPQTSLLLVPPYHFLQLLVMNLCKTFDYMRFKSEGFGSSLDGLCPRPSDFS